MNFKAFQKIRNLRFLALSDPTELASKFFSIRVLIKIIELTPSFIFKMLPNKFHLFLGKTYIKKNRIVDAGRSFDKSLKSELTAKNTIFFQADLYLSSRQDILLDYQKKILSDHHFSSGNSFSYLNWAFWNLGFLQFNQFFEEYLNHVRDHSQNNTLEFRNLPYHTSHLGHLGFLHHYINYYKNVDISRKLIIWPDLSPNKYFLNKIIKNSPLKITCISGKPTISKLDQATTDTLLYSLRTENDWKIELSAAAFSGAEFPELKNPEADCLVFEEQELNLGIKLASKIGLDLAKWFVILHIREPSSNSNFPKQNRDSGVENFREFCQQVQELGGQVVRMGDTRFPKLSKNFPAIDYAHSQLKSDFFDCWLWSQCRWWTGNMNGAAIAVMAFGKPRLLTDVWFWDTNAHNFDIWMPKLMYDHALGRYLTFKETIQHRLSRCQHPNIMHKNRVSLRNNSSQELQMAAKEMFQQTQIMVDTNLKSDEVSNFNAIFSNFSGVPETSPRASISTFFYHQWKNHLISPKN